MSFSWFVYAPLTPKEALAVEDRLQAAIDLLLADRPALVKKGSAWGEITVGADVPSADDVAELAEAYDRVVPEEVLDRLDECKAAIEIERNGTNDIDALQVSILRYLIDTLPPCLIDWGDFQIVTSESVKKDLVEFQSAGPLGGTPGETGASMQPESDDPSEEPVASADLDRSGDTAEAIEVVREDPFLQRRFMKALEKYPAFVKTYVKMIGDRGPVTDVAAAKELGVAADKLSVELDKLHGMATGLAGEVDDEEDD